MGEHEFVLGFRAKADELGSAVVGEPVEDEQHPDGDHSYQTTTTGLMWWARGGPVHFFEGVGR